MSAPKPNPFAELVVMAPMQIKNRLSMGNIYDLTIIDFYVKARRLAGVEVVVPLLWNINGKPLLDQIEKAGTTITEDSIAAYIVQAMDSISQELRARYLDYDFEIRDDQVLDELTMLTRNAYARSFVVGDTSVNECSSCGSIFGSDPSIIVCKHCGSATTISTRTTLYQKVHMPSIISKMRDINFIPPSGKEKLLEFLQKLPESYDLILEKRRHNTLSYAGFMLDPRFIAIMLPAVIQSSGYKRRVWIHGDVIKKLDYYGLCYLNADDCPTDIVIHGILQDAHGRKMRWQDAGSELALLEQVDNKVARALFLTSNIMRDRVLSPDKIQVDVRTLTKLYVKMGRILEVRNLDKDMHGIRPPLQTFISSFHEAVADFNYRDAFMYMTQFVDTTWKLVRDEKLSIDELHTLKNFKSLYFGI